jgi:hypothetical protein
MFLKIQDFIPLIGTDTQVEFNPDCVNQFWCKATVVGIDIPFEKLLLCVNDGEYKSYNWWGLYFQLNEQNPKYYRVIK